MRVAASTMRVAMAPKSVPASPTCVVMAPMCVAASPMCVAMAPMCVAASPMCVAMAPKSEAIPHQCSHTPYLQSAYITRASHIGVVPATIGIDCYSCWPCSAGPSICAQWVQYVAMHSQEGRASSDEPWLMNPGPSAIVHPFD